MSDAHCILDEIALARLVARPAPSLRDSSLPTHTHPRPALSFVARGSFHETTLHGVAVCEAGALHVRVSEEPHANQFDAAGTRLTIIGLPLESALGDPAIEGLVLAMLARLLRVTSTERAREFIDVHFARALQLVDVAAVAGFRPRSFARAFKRRYEITPWRYQRRRQLEWEKAELTRGDRTIAAIAHEAGFADHSHLARAFQAAEGKPPSAVRRAGGA